MSIINAIVIIIFCVIASVFLYGLWLVDNDRYEFRKKNGIDPKYHGWKVDKNDEDQTK
jgi:hypothetical protein